MRRVLIIEDEPDIREDIADILTEEGFNVATAENGDVGLKLLRNGMFCVVLLDLMMPVLDGWAFRAEQVKDSAIAKVPVVVVSGDGHVEQKVSSLKASGYLKKPFAVDDLVEIVTRFCQA